MNTQSDQNTVNGGSKSGFSFARGDDWMRFSADLNRLSQQIGQQVRSAMDEIDFEAIADEVRRATVDVASEVREAVNNFSRQQEQRAGATTVEADIRWQRSKPYTAEPVATKTAANSGALMDQRAAVLRMVAAGQISAEDANRLLEALER